jgi:hypothetical protein
MHARAQTYLTAKVVGIPQIPPLLFPSVDTPGTVVTLYIPYYSKRENEKDFQKCLTSLYSPRIVLLGRK